MQANIYSKKTGQIYVSMTGPDEESIKIQLPLYEDADYVIGDMLDNAKFYMPDGVKAERPVMDISVDETDLIIGKVNEPITITGIADRTRVLGKNFDVLVNDAEIEWTSAESGTFFIEFIKFPYRDRRITVEITDL